MANRKQMKRLPSWLRVKCRNPWDTHEIKSGLRDNSLHTVCEEARCPNIQECFNRKTATYLIMGNICTRGCSFCAVRSGTPLPIDPKEPSRVADHAKSLGLKHVVVTSVTRDDLPDGGAEHFVKTISELRKIIPDATIEVLTPDFKGSNEALELVCGAKPNIFNHNLETVRRLTNTVRNGASYDRSLMVLKRAGEIMKDGYTKSGLMLGLGESQDEVVETLSDLRNVGCDIVTIGQYLRPSRDAYPVVEYLKPHIFEKMRREALQLGFRHVFSGPLVRSSYMADKIALEEDHGTDSPHS